MWVLRRPEVTAAIVGARNAAQAHANAALAGEPLSEEETRASMPCWLRTLLSIARTGTGSAGADLIGMRRAPGARAADPLSGRVVAHRLRSRLGKLTPRRRAADEGRHRRCHRNDRSPTHHRALADAGMRSWRFRVAARRVADAPGVAWDPATGPGDPSVLAGVDAVVNLAGANIGGGRWTDERKREIVDSRVVTTSRLVEAIGTGGPRTLIKQRGRVLRRDRRTGRRARAGRG